MSASPNAVQDEPFAHTLKWESPGNVRERCVFSFVPQTRACLLGSVGYFLFSFQPTTNTYSPRDRDWVKDQIYKHLKRAVGQR